MKKTCKRCGIPKDTGTAFYKDKRTRDGLYSSCKSCQMKISMEWQSKNKDKIKAYQKKWNQENLVARREQQRRGRVMHLYGISLEEYEQLKKRGICRVCNTRPKKLHIDHCHSTGLVRGVLCPGCNMGLGHFRDNPELLRAAARYLEEPAISDS